MGHAVLEFVSAGHQRRARRRARRADVEIGETQALLEKRVGSRRVDDRIAKTGIVAITDVIRHDDDDIGAFGRCCSRPGSG